MNLTRIFQNIIITVKNRIFYKIQNYFSPEEKNRQLSIEYLDGTNKKIIRRFFEAGGIKSENIYEDSKLNGICLNYYESGKAKSKENYVNDVREGVSLFYSEDGKSIEEEFYIYGKLIKKNILK